MWTGHAPLRLRAWRRVVGQDSPYLLRPELGRGQLGLRLQRAKTCALEQAGRGSNPPSPPPCVARDKPPPSSLHCSPAGDGNNDPEAAWVGVALKRVLPARPREPPPAAPPGVRDLLQPLPLRPAVPRLLWARGGAGGLLGPCKLGGRCSPQ